MKGFKTVYITAKNRAEARKLAMLALDMRLAACANLFPIDSIYWWKGKKEHAKEVAILFKTRAALVKRLIAGLRKAHSYDVPCIVAWPILEGNRDYLDWIARETK